MAKKLVLIDGHSILNRAFYGVPDTFTNKEGLHTNAVFGFLNILFSILEEEKPEYLMIAFDVHAPTFRHEIYKEYKGTRKPMADELREQVPVMKDLLRAMNITLAERAGLEADDILGSMAKQSEAKGIEVSLVSGDRDLLQIASDHIKVRIPKTKAGKTQIEDYYAKDVLRTYQVTPKQFIELKALMGDSSDNIPGVPKVGEKTATELMTTYGSIEEIYAHLDEIKKKSIRESLRENRALCDLSYTLAKIKTDCDLGIALEDTKIKDFYTKEAYEICKNLEFKAILKRFDKNFQSGADSENTITITPVEDAFALSSLVLKVSGLKKVATRVFLLPEDDFLWLLFDGKEEIFCLTKEGLEKGGVDVSFAVNEIRKAMEGKGRILTFGVKDLYHFFGRYSDQTDTSEAASSSFEDLLLEAYLLNPLKSDHTESELIRYYLDCEVPSPEEATGKKKIEEQIANKETFFSCESRLLTRYEALHDEMSRQLSEQSMSALYREIEMPLSYVLYRMEKEGIRASKEALLTYGKELEGRIVELEAAIYKAAGEEFNINSPKQLGVILFEKMGLPGGKKTKTGYSTSADVLEKLSGECPMVKDVLEYRTYTKLKSTYADGLADYIASDGRIHTTLNQTITATGRISSTEPNLQNIPMRMELGRKIRKVFTPKEGYVFADADYSQIELRILASLAKDEGLIEAYRMGDDIHRITASKVFGIPMEEVTDLQRRNAKAVNFGIVYGISSFGLSQDLSIGKKEAAQYIEQYFETYPGIKQYLENVKNKAKSCGYSETYFHRRRPIPELKNSNFMTRQFGERVAMNAPIQGTAADVIKIAMLKVYDRLLTEGLKARLILQIHDELLIETPREELDDVMKILIEEMKQAVTFPVELEVDAHWGNDWYEAK